MAAYAQAPLSYMYDGIANSENNPYGTARSMALGNAMTAVGGDLGAVAINPAGGAVARYGQFAITPGLTISSSNASFSPVGESSYGASSHESKARMNFPSAGASIRMTTGRDKGLRAYTMTVLLNQMQDYNSSMIASGVNSKTSLLSEFASAACGYYHNELVDYTANGASWDLVSGYNGRLFGGLSSTIYAGNSEVETPYGYAIPAPLAQTSSTMTNGYRRDFIIGWSFDISGNLYLGFNLGLPTMYKNLSEGYFEAPYKNYMDFYICLPDKGGNFVDTFYTGSRYMFSQYTRMTGIYAKFGAIWLPADNVRLGFAIQTPTSYSVTEGYTYSASSTYENTSCNGSSTSPVDEWSYKMRSPFSFNVGLAYTFAGRGLFTLDADFTDYRVMKYTEAGGGVEYFYDVNQTINKFCGISKTIRAGVEYKLTPEFSARAGFNLATSPERTWGGKTAADFYGAMPYYGALTGKGQYVKDKKTAFSLGFGYSSPGSFFADFAVRVNNYPTSVYLPYYDYDHMDANGVLHQIGSTSEELSPRIRINRTLWDAMITFGWRF